MFIFPEPRMAVSRIMTLPDPRQPLGKRHVLTDMLVIAICAVIEASLN